MSLISYLVSSYPPISIFFSACQRSFTARSTFVPPQLTFVYNTKIGQLFPANLHESAPSFKSTSRGILSSIVWMLCESIHWTMYNRSNFCCLDTISQPLDKVDPVFIDLRKFPATPEFVQSAVVLFCLVTHIWPLLVMIMLLVIHI